MAIRVLLADPNGFLLDSYRRHLWRNGFEVATATDGLQCLEKLRQFTPDVLVLEPMLRWGGGDGVLTVMFEDPDTPVAPVVILLTYGCDPGVLYNIGPFSIDDYQMKPMTAQRLVERIHAALPPRVSQEAANRSAMVGPAAR
ncbi:MAG: response regulator [Pirellulales bacterium]